MELLDTLGRWNPWGTGRLDAGFPRDLAASLNPFLDTPDVVALVGPRRAGKTTVLYQIMDRLRAAGRPPEAFLHVNLEEPGLAAEMGTDLLDRVYDTYREEVHPRGRAWVFLDEVQRIPGWERWVRARGETEDIKVFVTGSSSALLSREMGTLLTGRHVRFTVRPLSFGEFLRFKGVPPPSGHARTRAPAAVRNALGEYLRYGGFPEVVLATDPLRKEALLRQYFDDILFNDVALRHQVRDLNTLRMVAVYLLTQTSSLVSLQRLGQVFGVSLDAARAYCAHLEEAFLVRFLPFYSLKAAERRRRPQKVHACDTGLRNAVCLSGSPDRGRLAETVVHNALCDTEDYGLFYWKGETELDLLVRRGHQVVRLVQITDGVPASGSHGEVRPRETAALIEAGGAFPGAQQSLIVAGHLREMPPVAKGIEVVPLWRFLGRPGAV